MLRDKFALLGPSATARKHGAVQLAVRVGAPETVKLCNCNYKRKHIHEQRVFEQICMRVYMIDCSLGDDSPK
jgi:hypothetical protein